LVDDAWVAADPVPDDRDRAFLTELDLLAEHVGEPLANAGPVRDVGDREPRAQRLALEVEVRERDRRRLEDLQAVLYGRAAGDADPDQLVLAGDRGDLAVALGREVDARPAPILAGGAGIQRDTAAPRELDGRVVEHLGPLRGELEHLVVADR